jgi:uncharacterized membrane protein YfcA
LEASTAVLLAANLIVLFAFFTRALTGFGGALLCVPLLALFFDMQFVVPVECSLEVVLSLILVPRVWRLVDGRNLAVLLVGALAGSFIGVGLLQSLTDASLKGALGVFVILAGLHLLHRNRAGEAPPISRAWGLVAGVIGGVLGGVFGTPGPAYVAYLAYQTSDQKVFRATLITLFAIEYTWRLVLFIRAGLYTMTELEFSLWLVPSVVAAAVGGHFIHPRLDERVFRSIVCALLIVSGVLCFL